VHGQLGRVELEVLASDEPRDDVGDLDVSVIPAPACSESRRVASAMPNDATPPARSSGWPDGEAPAGRLR